MFSARSFCSAWLVTYAQFTQQEPGNQGLRPETTLIFEGRNSPEQRGALEFLNPGALTARIHTT